MTLPLHPCKGETLRLAGCFLLAALAAFTPSVSNAAEKDSPHIDPNVRMNAPQLPLPEGKLGRMALAIAADKDGRRLVAAWEDLRGSCGPPVGESCPRPDPPGLTSFGYSTDGGRTWKDAGSPPLAEGSMTGGHAWLDRGGVDGNTFFLVNRGRNPKDFSQSGLTFHRGRFNADGVFVWEDGKLITSGKPGDVLRSSSVAAARDGSGKVYMPLSRLRAMCGQPSRSVGQIELMRSEDEGRTWEGPVIVAPDELNETADPMDPECGQKGPFQISPSPAIGPGGELYLIWQYGPQLLQAGVYPMVAEREGGVRFARSLDGGKTFSAPKKIVELTSMWENPPIGYSKDNLLDFNRIAVDRTGPHRGRIYVSYTSAVSPAATLPSVPSVISSQVFLVHSDDRGETWSKPVPLSPPVPPTGVKRFRSSVTVEDNGTVDVAYVEIQERQATPDPDDRECTSVLLSGQGRSAKVSSFMDLYWVRSTDGGATFGPPVRVTSKTTNWCATFYNTAGQLFSNLGDYLGIFGGRDRAYVVWTDGRDYVPDAYFAEIGGK